MYLIPSITDTIYGISVSEKSTNINIMPYRESDIIIINDSDCDHIDTSSCRKRIFNLYDFENLCYKRIIVCNEKIKLLYNEYSLNKTIYTSYHDFIIKYLATHIKVYDSCKDFFVTRCNSMYFTYIPCCERPKIYHKLSITDYVECLYNHRDNRHNYYILCKEFIYSFEWYLKKANLKKHTFFINKLRDIKNTMSYDSEKDILLEINDLFTIIINNKY